MNIPLWETPKNSIELKYFIRILRRFLNEKGKNTENCLKVFFQLLDEGLELVFEDPMYDPNNCTISNQNVLEALIQIDNSLGGSTSNRWDLLNNKIDPCNLYNPKLIPVEIFNIEKISIESGLEIPVGDISINKRNLQKIYEKMGQPTCPWVFQKWNDSGLDFQELDVTDRWDNKAYLLERSLISCRL